MKERGQILEFTFFIVFAICVYTTLPIYWARLFGLKPTLRVYHLLLEFVVLVTTGCVLVNLVD